MNLCNTIRLQKEGLPSTKSSYSIYVPQSRHLSDSPHRSTTAERRPPSTKQTGHMHSKIYYHIFRHCKKRHFTSFNSSAEI